MNSVRENKTRSFFVEFTKTEDKLTTITAVVSAAAATKSRRTGRTLNGRVFSVTIGPGNEGVIIRLQRTSGQTRMGFLFRNTGNL